MKKLFILTVFLGVICAGCASGRGIVWRSEPQGDFAPDRREPLDVCVALQKKDALVRRCTLIESKTSSDENECESGMGVSGCFACKFSCP